MSKQVATEVWTLQTIRQNNIAFVIPSYQRPYVWHDDDVLKLFDDIVTAYKNNDSHYFIGTVLTAKNDQSEFSAYELIDGQQRTTTLMLMSLAFKAKKIQCELSGIATIKDQPRLTFLIREQVQELLGYWAGLEGYNKPTEVELDENEYLIRVDGALRALQGRLAQYVTEELLLIADYIFNRVQWVNNVMPIGMDVNRLFATANTTGIQLEQTDILKAFLIKHIKPDEKARYEAIWQACEQMDNYFERNVKEIFSTSKWKTIQPEQLARFDDSIFLLKSDEQAQGSHGLSIGELAQNCDHTISILTTEQNTNENEANNDEPEKVYCRSIVSFALLLLHAYRIFRSNQPQLKTDIDEKLHSDRLIDTFKPFLIKASESEIKAFFECLWQVRFQFDRCVIKWVKQPEDEEQRLTLTKMEFSKTNNAIQRSPKKGYNLTALESICYFTSERSTQYWLTPLLGWLVEQNPKSTQEILQRLEQIDNQLSLTKMTQKEASFVLLTKNLPKQSLDDQITYLQDPKGTGFEHYWFQKLEYLLWKHRGDYLKETDNAKLEKYRITSKNSVEHVHPQNEEHGRKLPDEFLHAFGNLVLLSVGQNSSYGNKSVSVKESMFNERQSFDSLKLAHIFLTKKGRKWDQEAITNHQKTMLDLLRAHYLN